MATQHGRLKEFHPESDSVKAYLERTSLYFTANDVPNAKKVAVLLSTIGGPTYSLLSDLVAPDSPGEKSFAEISEALRRHFEPKRTTIAERFHFHKRDQAAGESVADFDAALRKLAIHCNFADALEDTLRDRFVCGLCSDAMQRRLLSEKELSYRKAMEVAQAMEAAERETKALKPSAPAIHKFASQNPRSKEQRNCYRCGRSNHGPAECRFKEADCRNCGKKGHIATVCRSKPRQTTPTQPKAQHPGRSWNTKHSRRTHQVQEDAIVSDSEGSSDEYHLHKVGERSSAPIEVEVSANGRSLTMEMDTGAALSIISEATKNAVFPDLPLHRSRVILKTYTGEPMRVIGNLHVCVRYGTQAAKLVLVVVAGDGPSLFGRNWLNHIQPELAPFTAVRTINLKSLDGLMQQHAALFSDTLGTVEPFRATLHVPPDAIPKFCKARSVPFAIKDAIGKELDRMEQQGILRKVSHSEWAAPIVPVPKKDGRFRICGDYKVTVNQSLSVDQYPLPKPEDLFASLAGGTVFSKLDLSQAYLQLQLDEKSVPYATINTHQGLYHHTRLPFGVASAPAVFQKMMDTVLQGIPGVICYIDDILVSGKDEASHLEALEAVFKRLEKHGFRLKREKCEFLTSAVEYLGHVIGKEGVHPLPNKVTAIEKAPAPKNTQELRSFLGLLNYYGKFIPNLSTLLHPLNALLQAETKWAWSKECAEAFQLSKDQLTSAQVLTHYDPALPLNLAADASAYGVGAVISHVMPDGSERPIAFASRTLSTSEKNYAQLEKEALSLVFGVKKFHQYLYGRKFTLITDHQPLTTILGPKRGIPSLAAARLQRWAILLSAYVYDIKYKSTHAHGNADGLSRLPLPATRLSKVETDSIFNVGQIHALPVTFRDVRKVTRRDPTLSKVLTYVHHGWPDQVEDALRPFKTRQDEIGVEGDCLMWGIRVIVPDALQKKVLSSLHDTHPGATRMKATARSYFWWSGLDKAIEDLVRSCSACQVLRSAPVAAPLHPWVWPDTPWKRIHVDFAGPFRGKMYFIIVDAHSKWPEVITMSSTTSQHTIDALRALFSHYGFPEQLASDNGPQFTSDEFSEFMKEHGIKHILSAPYHPSSNGLAERFVRTFKRAMIAGEKDGRTPSNRLAEFLLRYRASPHATTGVSPSELFLQRRLRITFDLLRPDTKGAVDSKQSDQKRHHDKHLKLRALFVGTPVMVRDYRHTHKWIPGTVTKKLGPVTYSIDVGDGRIWKRHIDQLIERLGPSVPPESSGDAAAQEDGFQYPAQPEQEPARVMPPPPQRGYPQRDRRPPERLMLIRC